MSREVWNTILSKYVVPYRHVNAHLNPPTLIPHKDGEPLLHKRLPEFLKAASEVVPDMHIDIYSHGLLLPKRPGFIDFLGSLPNKVRLLVSFHFFNHDGSENDYRPVTDFFKRLFSGPTPDNVSFVFASHLVVPMTAERLGEWRESWRPYFGRVEVHANVQINPWTGLIEGPGLTKFDGCPYYRFDHLFFGATGNMVPCCLDLEEEVVFGNVMRDDPAHLFGTAEAFYAARRRREVDHELCYNCFGRERPRKSELLQIGGVV